MTSLLCDLHTHSRYSDGTDSPAVLLQKAHELGLAALVLCDHNTVDGIPALWEAAAHSPVTAIAGGEFSVDYQGTELHLLGLFLTREALPAITERMTDYLRRKDESNRLLIESLRRAGYPLDYDTICRRTPEGKVNRAHVAAALTEAGYVSSRQVAFETLLAPAAGHYTEPQRPTVWEMLTFLRELGAVTVLAHPFLNLSEEALTAFLPRAKAAGLMGMECAYPLFDSITTAKALAMAEAFGLLPSGGSDYHGGNKPDIHLGVGHGDLAVPLSWAEALRQAAEG